VVTKTTVDRADALVERIERLGENAHRPDAVALGLVDALLEHDVQTLARALDALREARAAADGDGEAVGWLDAAIAFAHWGLERSPSPVAVAAGTQAHAFLRAVGGAQRMSSVDLRSALDVDETQVSRTGRRLLESGLVARSKAGRQVFWQLTPRGRTALSEAPARSANWDFWQEALRRGFEAAAGDEPGEARDVDPTRERIIEVALDLHLSNGIQATTWPEIADRSGVPVDTIESMFPTLNDLARSCGAHFVETLHLPPEDRAPEVFAGVPSGPQRIHRMVETVFGAYERGGEGMALARRERDDVPAVAESIEAIETTFDALISEALRPLDAKPSAVASLRALTDLEVWRTLREHGAAPDAAVDEASATVERWLDAQPARQRVVA
jgi:AcrR family transcriptional regulator